MNKVNIDTKKVEELMAKGYSNAQIKASLGIKKSTWDRWYKDYKEQNTPKTPIDTPKTPEAQSQYIEVKPTNPTGRGGVRYRYTDSVKYNEWIKEDAFRILEQNMKTEITHKPAERVIKPEIPEELLQYDQIDVPYDVWTKYIDESKGEHWGTFVMRYGRWLEPKEHKSVKTEREERKVYPKGFLF